METAMHKSNPTLPQLRKDRGFTMIELMVTVLILGILTSVALPSFKEFIANQRIKSSSFDLMSTLNQARSEAIKRNGQVTIAPINNDWAQGWTVSTNVPTATTLIQKSALTGLAVTCVPGPSCSSVIYNGNGRSNASQSIQVSSTAIPSPKVTCISVDLSGLPKSKKANC